MNSTGITVERFNNLVFRLFDRFFTDRFAAFTFVEALLLRFFGAEGLGLSEDIFNQ
jgi:hypothetical protein